MIKTFYLYTQKAAFKQRIDKYKTQFMSFTLYQKTQLILI